MSPSALHSCASPSSHILLCLVFILTTIPDTVTFPSMASTALPERTDWRTALLHLRAALEATRGAADQPDRLRSKPWVRMIAPEDLLSLQLLQALLEDSGQDAGEWEEEEEVLLRAQRRELDWPPTPPFPGGSNSLDGLYYQEGGDDGGEGGNKNKALTSIAGGLQAFSREKGGFGFRFGRKRRTAYGNEGREKAVKD